MRRRREGVSLLHLADGPGPGFGLLDALDILIIAFVIYRVLLLLRRTRAVTLLKGLAVIFAATAVSRLVGLRAVGWLLTQLTTGIIVALPVVFYPELRRTLEHIGRGGLLHRPYQSGQADFGAVVRSIAHAAESMSRSRTGALIVLERETGLSEYVETGVRLEARVTPELLENVFVPNTPLHDGAVIIRGDRMMAAGCFLPLSESRALSPDLGTRHRAAVGISEVSDATAVVVSEETGTISLAIDGTLERFLDATALEARLDILYRGPEASGPIRWWRPEDWDKGPWNRGGGGEA